MGPLALVAAMSGVLLIWSGLQGRSLRDEVLAALRGTPPPPPRHATTDAMGAGGVVAPSGGKQGASLGLAKVATPAQIAQLAYDAGLRGRDTLAIAVAVALGESGGRTDAMGDTTITTGTWGPSVGLWQIRSLKLQRDTGGTRDADALVNPRHNARSMVAISSGGRNWQPWTVYKTGAYRAHLDVARSGVDAIALGSVGW